MNDILQIYKAFLDRVMKTLFDVQIGLQKGVYFVIFCCTWDKNGHVSFSSQDLAYLSTC